MSLSSDARLSQEAVAEAVVEAVVVEAVVEPAVVAASVRSPLPLAPPAGPDLRGLFAHDAAFLRLDRDLPAEVFSAGPITVPTPEAPSVVASPQASRAPGPVSLTAARSGEAAPARPRRNDRRSEETLPRGAIIDKYRIDRLLGRGGFAAVYRATHLLLNTQVAIKLLRPQALAKNPQLAQLLWDEARFAARIDHPNVVRVHDVTHTPSITYIVMEFIDGRSLAETIGRTGQLSPARVVEVGTGVVAGLKVALSAGLIHRDIKPANILLGRRGEIKIVDLGLVRRIDADALADEAAAPEGPPARRATIGTFGYMAPEQAVDPEKIDFRADIYSLGATLYEAAVGAPPFPHARGGTFSAAFACIEAHAHQPVPPPEERVPGFPQPLSALLLRMLGKRPEDRFPSYDALAEALTRVGKAIAAR